MKKSLYYVTTNSGKFAEVSEYIHAHMPDIELKQFSVDLPEIQSLDQMAIALDKAKQAWNIVQKPLLLDDAGIYFEKYSNFPGTLSKFVSQGLGFEGLKRLIDLGDRAHFLLQMIYIDGPDTIQIFEGRCDGSLHKPVFFDADPSLPYDTFFIPDGLSLTYAKMRLDFEQHAGFFYRIRALQKFISWYKNYASAY